MNNEEYEVTIAKLEVKYDRTYSLACQMLLAIVVLVVWCLSLVYSNCKLEEKYSALENEILSVVTSHE